MRRALSLRLACQAAVMKVSANIIVQLLVPWRKGPDHFTFDYQQVLEFAAYGSFNSQLSNIIQFMLEDWFPATRPAADSQIHLQALPSVEDRQQLEVKKDDDVSGGGAAASAELGLQGKLRSWFRISPDVIWSNLLAKLILDQTIGLAISGVIFLFITNYLRVPNLPALFAVIRERIFTLIKAGWHIWPVVALANFLWVPVRSRVLVAVFVGFGWSIFLSVFAMKK
ncbi:unnamed protein product [Clonostachys chloroleuca]|uniref:PXMP2/4 family protein 3 n=1 Tax=Clonostachys chloroleuca TaxID=1926264 RepID=A0AA35LUR1_9HYPO|nr:unnamed protein product [Clonostachys chloroleuca]